jgi:hypothetical protein
VSPSSSAAEAWSIEDESAYLRGPSPAPVLVLLREGEVVLREGWVGKAAPTAEATAPSLSHRESRIRIGNESTQPVGRISIAISESAQAISEALQANIAAQIHSGVHFNALSQTAFANLDLTSQKILTRTISASIASSLAGVQRLQNDAFTELSRNLHVSFSRLLVRSFTPALLSVAHSLEESSVGKTRLTNDPAEAVDLLCTWLDLTHDELASITGIAKTTFFYWKRTGAKPYRKTSRPLWRFYGLAETIVRQVGEMHAPEWIREGDPSTLALLLEGDLDSAESRVHAMAFRQPDIRPDKFFAAEGSLVGEETEEPVDVGSRARRAHRRPVRRRLGGS